MRFLTAYFAVNDGRNCFDWFATYDRASNKSFVEALEQLGAKYPMKRSGLSAHSIKGQNYSFKVTYLRMLAASTFRRY
jgi:hypothetical protein